VFEQVREDVDKIIEMIDTPIKGFGPCVVMVIHPNADDRLYGPFRNGTEAMRWVHTQRYVRLESMGVLPLRTPDRERSYGDLWNPFETQEDLVLEFPESVYDWWQSGPSSEEESSDT